jgi:hypothetical protein
LGAEILVGRLNRRLVGWANYFCLGPVSKAYRAVDRHVTTRLRRWLREKHKTPRVGTTRFPDEYLYHTLGLVRLPRLTRNLPWANARTSLSESRMREIRPVRFDEREVETEPPSHRATSRLYLAAHAPAHGRLARRTNRTLARAG